MTAVSTLITRAARLLSDNESGYSHTSWTQADLLDYYHEALCTIYGLRPSEFTECATITLKPGSKQTVPDGCGTLLSIDSNTADPTTGEAEGSPVTMSSSDMMKAFGGKRSCAQQDNCAPYEMQSYRTHKTSQNIFFVEPPVPTGVEPSVEATLSKPPVPVNACDIDSESGLDCSFDAAIVDWIVYRAYSEDTESQYAAQVARRHQAAFYDLINAGYIADGRIRSGAIMGQEANHDGSNAWRHDIRNFGR